MKKLPKFLFADNSLESLDLIYVVHTQNPRCIIQCDVEEFEKDQHIFWLDETPDSKKVIEKVLKEAKEFIEEELDNEDILYDEEEDRLEDLEDNEIF